MATVCAAQKNLGSKEISDKFCPVCDGSGGMILTLRQINAEEAVYVCENPACCYPVGYDAQLVRRPILALLDGAGDKKETANPSGKEPDKINGVQPVKMAGMYEDSPWHSTTVMEVMDSLLDPEVADFFDSMQ